MANKGNAGMAKLAIALDSRIREHRPQELVIDFAEILSGYQLKANTFPELIPPSDYMVCRQLTLGNTGEVLAGVSTTDGAGQAYVPEKMRKLKPGDSVVIAWVQNTAVVLDIIVKADKL